MTNIPELTDDEATVMRFLTISQTDRFTAAVPKIDSIADDDDVSLAALAAYDAKKRAAIRVEAMRECEVEAVEQSSYRCGYCGAIVDAIREKIAKEQTNGQS